MPPTDIRYLAIGPSTMPWSRLTATATIEGRSHHIDAIAIQDDPVRGSNLVDTDDDPLLRELYRHCGDDTVFRQAEIEGRPYMLAITPFHS
jgi:hypothetical protein